MNIQDSQSNLSVEFAGRTKVNELTRIQLIRKFQRLEGNLDCCASAYTRVCKQFECTWRDECMVLVKNDMP